MKYASVWIALANWKMRLLAASMLRRLACWICPPPPSPWKLLAVRLRHQRDAFDVTNLRYKRLLIWLLTQIAAEADAADLLSFENSTNTRGPRGQA